MGLFNKSSNRNASLSIIAKNCRVTGDIELVGDIQIDGHGEGNIVTARSVVISAEGHFKGEIHAEHITINGLVEGKCIARDVDILPQGKMKGQIKSEQLTIQKGGILIGENSSPGSEPALSVVGVEEKKPKEKVRIETKAANEN